MPKQSLHDATLNYKTRKIMLKIIVALKEPISISEIARRTQLNRSNLRYYLNLLRAENKIIFERQEQLAGRPTYVKLNKVLLSKIESENKKEFVEYSKKIEENPFTKALLLLLAKEKRINQMELFQIIRNANLKMDISTAMNTIQWLTISGYINDFYEISNKGLEFIQKNGATMINSEAVAVSAEKVTPIVEKK